MSTPAIRDIADFAPKLAELIIFIVMAIVLLVRPSGLFGEAGLAE